MYFVLSFEIIKKLPYMEKFKEKEKEVEKELAEEDEEIKEDKVISEEKKPNPGTLGDTCRCTVCAYRPCKIPVDQFCPMYYGGEKE